jgi:hypothetical protein
MAKPEALEGALPAVEVSHRHQGGSVLQATGRRRLLVERAAQKAAAIDKQNAEFTMPGPKKIRVVLTEEPCTEQSF